MSLKVLVVRYSAIGDVVLSTAIIRSIGEALPSARIDVLAGTVAFPLLENNPYISEIIPLSPKQDFIGTLREVRKRKYDLLINLQGNNRSAILSMFSGAILKVGSHPVWAFPYNMFKKDTNERIHAVDFYFSILRLVIPDALYRLPEIYLLDEEVESVKDKLIGKGVSEGFFCFNPAVSCSSREWLPDYYVKIGRYFVSKGLSIVILGGPSEHDRELAYSIANGIGDGAYNLAGELSLRETAAVISLCKMFFSGDTGPMHIAAAVGTKVVAFFGPSDPVRAAPLGLGHKVFFDRNLPCLGCYKKECADKYCMKNITPEMVIEKVGF